MNKIMSAIIGGALGVTLIASVGLGIGVGGSAKQANAASNPFTTIFDFEDSTAHRTSGKNSFTAQGNSYTENNTAISLTYADSVTTGSPLNGSANVMGRVAKKTTNSPVVLIGPLSLESGTVINSITYIIKGPAAFKAKFQYSTNGSSYTTLESEYSLPTSVTTKGVSNKSISATSLYLKWTITVQSSTNNARDFQLDDVTISGTSPSGGQTTTYEYSDYLTRYTTERPINTYYGDWSNKRLRSAAVYAGKSAGDNNAIQINSTNKDSGIISTTSGGIIKSVEINFNSHTNTSRDLYIYGSNTAYSSPTELWSENTQGTQIGQVTYGTKGQTVTPAGSYSFIGIRSHSGAIYLDSVIITWETTTEQQEVSSLEVTSMPTKTTYGVGETLDLTGLEVTAHFPTSSNDRVTTDITYSVSDGYTFQNEDTGTYTVTVTSRHKSQITTSFNLTVLDAFPVSIDKTAPIVFLPGMKFNEGTGTFEVTLSSGEKVSNIKIGDDGTSLKVNNSTVLPTAVVDSYIGQTAEITYTANDVSVSYEFVVKLESNLDVDHFDDVPEYVLSGESATVIAHFISFIGTPSVTVTSLEPSYLTVGNNPTVEMDGYVGSIAFTVTAGNTAGQYSVEVTISKNGESASNTCSIIVREAAPGHEGSGEYQLIDSSSDLTDGKYVVAANVNDTYHAMRTAARSTKLDSSEITVDNDGIITSSTSTYDIFDFQSTADGFVISNTVNETTNYVAYPGSGTNLEMRSTPVYYWEIAESSLYSGTFAFTALTTKTDDTPRGLIFRSSTYNLFGGYALSNVTSAKKAEQEYFTISLFKYTGDEQEETGATEFELVKGFVDTYMHMNDIPITDTSDTGACRGSSGYYLIAKAGWNTMVTSYTGQMNLQSLFQERFPDAYERYITWAEKNGDSQPFSGTTIVPANAKTKSVLDGGASTTVIVVISALSLTTLAAYFLLKKKIHK